MGISSKWIKLLVRTRKKEKAQNAEKCGTSSATESPHKQKHSMDPEAPFTVDLAVQSEPSTGDTNMQTISNSTSSTSTSLQVHVSQTEHMKEDWAATAIQSAFRAFLARRALHALKGIVRLQALVRGHAVRKQAAETLKCMEALAKAQARMRTRQVHIALESQVAQKKVPEQECRETHVQEIAEGWCDGIGSVEEMQAKVSRRQEAAAKRERARAYALTHQWQAGSRQQKAANPQGLEMDQEYWRCDWLERWMAVRPWENRLLDNNSKESVPMHDGKQAEENEVKAQNKLKCKVPISTTASNSPSKKKGVKHKKSYSDVSGSPSGQSASTLYSTSLGSSRLKPKPSNEISEEVSSQPSDVPSQSISNTNERMMQVNTPDKKRLSLPNGGGGAGKGAANKSPINWPTTSKTLRDVPKPDPKPRPNPPNPAGKPAESQA